MYKESTAAIVIYDVSDLTKKSYDDVRNWVNELWKNNDKKKIPIVLLGNKIDLRQAKIPTLKLDECRNITRELSQECGIKIPQIEISALARENVDKIIDTVLDVVIKTQNLTQTNL